MSKAVALYCDGGVIGVNPSKVGGSWAWCHVDATGQRIHEASGFVSLEDSFRMEGVTNNLTEMIALVYGLESLPTDWIGTVYSDSQITLGRVFLGWKLKNIPAWLIARLGHLLRSRRIDQMTYVQLDGHPTRAQLLAGVGKRGNPVSEHNVWCDEACQDVARGVRKPVLV